MILNFILLVVGFVLLIKGADVLVDGSASIAKKFGLSSLMIGLTIIAFGTSAPELIVNIFSSIAGSSDIGMGNIIGSNISNILLILGIAAIITNLEVADSIVKKQIPFSILAVLALFFLINDSLINNIGQNGLYRSGGLVLLLFFGIFLYYTFSLAKEEKIEAEEEIKNLSNIKAFFFIILGILALFVGGKLIVDNASAIAISAGLSEAFIGLTIVALGTSLPELAASIVAARKNQIQMAVGNVIGSNIFNLLWVLGLSALIKPIEFNPDLNFDIIFLILVSLLLFVLIYTGKKLKFTRKEGYVLVALYLIYIISISFRG